MAQFDVCRNRGRSREGFPYFVVVQSRAFDRTARRVVVPLTVEVAAYPPIAPAFDVEGRRVVADALLIFSMPREQLGAVVVSFADDERAALMIEAIDRVISRAWG
jgi:toxin CcdB